MKSLMLFCTVLICHELETIHDKVVLSEAVEFLIGVLIGIFAVLDLREWFNDKIKR